MPKTYTFALKQDRIKLVLENHPGTLADTWHAPAGTNLLMSERGDVRERPDGLHCLTSVLDGEIVVLLRDASWQSKVGDQGTADVEGEGCVAEQSWKLVELR